MSPPAHSVLDTARVDAGARFALFRAGLGASHDVHRLAGDERPFAARLEAWLLGDMVVTAGHQMGARIVRTDDRIRADGLDYVTFMLVRQGEVSGMAGGPVAWGAGEVGVLDTALPADLVTSDNRNIGVRLPRQALARAGAPPALHGRVIRATAARIVGGHLGALLRYAADVSEGDEATLVRATASIVADCLADTAPALPPAGGQGARARIVAYIEERLEERTLDAASLCAALSLSRPTLYRAMQPHGGVAAYLLARRLDAIRALLAEPEEPRTIAALAFAHGFTSYAHFSTAFRHRFGCSPRAARAAGGGRSARPDATAVAYRAWLRGLGDAAG